MLRGRAVVEPAPGNRDSLSVIHRSRAIAELPASDAPVALRIKFGSDLEYVRWHNGAFYRAVSIDGHPVIPGPGDMEKVDTSVGACASEGDAITAIEKRLAEFVVIDGALWAEESEPVLHVSRDGMYTDVLTYGGRLRDTRLDPWDTFALREAALALTEAASRLKHHYGMTLDPAPTADGLMDILMPEVFTGPTRDERIQAARDAARTDAAEAISELQADLSPESMETAGNRLLRAAKTLKRDV